MEQKYYLYNLKGEKLEFDSWENYQNELNKILKESRELKFEELVIEESKTEKYPSGNPVVLVNGVDQFKLFSCHVYWSRLSDKYWEEYKEKYNLK